jgi:hypothetical protein
MATRISADADWTCDCARSKELLRLGLMSLGVVTRTGGRWYIEPQPGLKPDDKRLIEEMLNEEDPS